MTENNLDFDDFVLSPDDLAKTTILRKAVINADTVFVSDLNESLSVPNGSFSVFLEPEATLGEEVSLLLLVVANKRDGILDIQAHENNFEETAN